MSLSERFWAKVERGPDSECWPWTAGRLKGGYGRIGAGGANGRLLLAHRVSYELAFGEIPEGSQIDHKCRNRWCVNPNHLRLATPNENQHNRGVNHNNSSGLKGAFKAGNKWSSAISINCSKTYLGRFDTAEAAHKAYLQAAEKLHGKFANGGV